MLVSKFCLQCMVLTMSPKPLMLGQLTWQLLVVLIFVLRACLQAPPAIDVVERLGVSACAVGKYETLPTAAALQPQAVLACAYKRTVPASCSSTVVSVAFSAAGRASKGPPRHTAAECV